ncbi:MAG TPA: IS630 family transposase [Bryobacteraceae bacterium]|nr:IS630 family transposase [Bryobacteraceae bacterium]
MPLPPAPKLVLTESEVRQLQAISRHRNTPRGVVLRVKIVLGAAQGIPNHVLARNLSTSIQTVLLWRGRYGKEGLSGILEDRHRSGRPKLITQEQESALIEATLNTCPKDDPYWSVRTMAARHNLSPATVQRIWKKYNLEPRRLLFMRLGADAEFASRAHEIVGLYLNPPERAVVLRVDELTHHPDESRVIRLLRPGWRRLGSTAIVALRILDNTMVAICPSRRRQRELLDFLEQIDELNPAGSELYLAFENAGTYKYPKVMRWLQERPRYHLHFTPGSSWLKQVERLLVEPVAKQLCSSAWAGIRDLVDTSKDFIGKYDMKPGPFHWFLQHRPDRPHGNDGKDTSETRDPQCHS